MMVKVVSVLLIASIFGFTATAFPLSASQISNRSAFLTNVHFQDPVQGLEALKVPLSLMAAAPRLEFTKNESPGNICSGTVVSDDGKLLTAAHCLRDCAEEAGLLQEMPGYYWAVDTKKLFRMNCSVKVNGVPTQFKVIAMAPCLATGFSYLLPDYQENCKRLDYAILVPTDDPIPNAPCLQISGMQPKVGADVFSIGFPKRSFRAAFKKGARSTDGKSLELTSGKVLAPQGKCFVDVDEKNRGGLYVKRGDKDFPNPQRTATLLNDVRVGRLIQTSTDILPGMSGSSLVDTVSGNIYGIAMLDEGNGELAFCSGGGFYSSTSKMLEHLRENFPDLDQKTALKCEERAIFPQQVTSREKIELPKQNLTREGIR